MNIINFVRSGYISIYDGFLNLTSVRGYSWPSSAGTFASITSANSNGLHFDAANLAPSNSLRRAYGFPVRCLASGA